ncbi:MAG: DeoR/GlpR family DNA-binding transcription regulator [Treponema sp.]|jgi:DeoR family glycerol-3-phosphate regulon repressor|nr:DeoR/GlpR family DNA-binding transcription regulator [Treponema sp.]
MFAEKRRENIVELVNNRGQVRVKDLSVQFSVTEDCIRKDLAILEQQGLLSRLYGGALKRRTNPHEFTVAQRLDRNTLLKQKIAARAFSLIHEGDTVFLDISTANVELAALLALSPLHVTVVTNMVEVMLKLGVPCETDMVFIGGSFGPGRDGFIGAAAIAAIEQYRFDTAFMGVAGVDLYRNRAETYLAVDGLTKQAAMKASEKKYLLVEARKFSNEAPFKYAGLEDFSGIVTAEKLDAEIKKALKRYPLEIV